MGATESSGKGVEDAAAEELTAAAGEAPEHRAAEDKFLQKNGQISMLNAKTLADETNGQFEERLLADVSSEFVNLKEDGTETIENLQDMDPLEPNPKDESVEMVNVVNLKEETEADIQVKDVNEVGLRKIFKFVGFKFNQKKETSSEMNEKEETEHNDKGVIGATENTDDAQQNKASDEIHKTVLPTAIEPSKHSEKEAEHDQGSKRLEEVKVTPEKETEKDISPEETVSPIKQFFSQGIFSSLRKKKKEEEIQECKDEELKGTENMEEDEKEDGKCMCLDIPHMLTEEEKDSQEKVDLPEGDLQNSFEKDKVQGSPLKRLFRKFSTRRQRESKTPEKLTEAEEQVSQPPKPSTDMPEPVEEATLGEQKLADEELVTDINPSDSRKKSDAAVSWETLICGGSKKRVQNTNEEEDKEKEHESPLGSSVEVDYDHLTASNDQSGSVAESGSTWETFKRMVTPKKKVRIVETSMPEQPSSEGEMHKDESFSIKKILSVHKKRKSDAKQEDIAKVNEAVYEDDETPAIVPLSEYEVIEPEHLKEMDEQRVEITIEHMIPDTSLEEDTFKFVATVSSKAKPTIIHSISDDFEELTDFLSKHQQLSDIPEEGNIEESVETPSSSAEWTTQDDTLAEDIVELTADAITAPEPESEELFGDDTTEMVTALSQLTESPSTSGLVTPVLKEHGVQTSETLLHEAIQSIYMTPNVQSVTTKDENQTSLAVSFSPFIMESSTPEETKVLVSQKITTATAICTGLLTQEIESVEKYLCAPLVEGIPEVNIAVKTELVTDNFITTFELAGLGTDKVHEVEVKNVKTEYQEIIENKEELAIESEPDIEILAEPPMEELGETHTDASQNDTVLDQMIPDFNHSPETKFPLDSADGQFVQTIQDGLQKELHPAKVDPCKIHVDEKDTALSEMDSEVSTKGASTKMEENVDANITQKGTQSTKDAVSTVVSSNVSEPGKQSLAGKMLSPQEYLKENANNETFDMDVDEDEENQLSKINKSQTTTGSDAKQKQVHSDVPDTSEDEFDNAVGPGTCKINMSLAEAKAKSVPTKILASQTNEIVPDTNYPEHSEQNEFPMTNENITNVKVVEMVAITENTTKQSEKVPQKSEEQKATEKTKDSSKINKHKNANYQITALKREISVFNKDTICAAPTLETNRIDPEVTESDAADIGDVNAGPQISISSESKLNSEASDMRQIAEPPFVKDTKDKTSPVTELMSTEHISPLSSEFTVEMPEVTISEIETQVVSELRAATHEVPEPKVETPVVTEINVETAIVTELQVERPIVTSLVDELEVETPVKTSMSKSLDAYRSAVQSQTLNINNILATETEKIENSPATSLDQVVPDVSMVFEEVEETRIMSGIVETTVIESVTARTTVHSEEEAQNLTPLVESQNFNSGMIMGEASPELAEADVVATVVETESLVKTIPSVIAEIPALVEKTVVYPEFEITLTEIPDISSASMALTMTSLVESPPVVSVSEILPPNEVTMDVMPVADAGLNPVIETSVLSVTSSTFVAVSQTPVADIITKVPVTIAEAAFPKVVTPLVAPETLRISVEHCLDISPAEGTDASLASPAVEKSSQISVAATETLVTAQAETLDAIKVLETESLDPEVETAIITPVVQTAGQISVAMEETEHSEMVSAEESLPEIPETHVVKMSQVSVFEAPVMTPIVQTSSHYSVRATEPLPQGIVSVVTVDAIDVAETSLRIPDAEKTVIETMQGVVLEGPLVTPLVQTTEQMSVRPTEILPQVTDKLMAVIETTLAHTEGEPSVRQTESLPKIILGQSASEETQAMIAFVETSEVPIIKAPVKTSVEQTSNQTLVIIEETSSTTDVTGLTASAKNSAMSSATKTSTLMTTQDSVLEQTTDPVYTSDQSLIRHNELLLSQLSSAVETSTCLPVVETKLPNTSIQNSETETSSSKVLTGLPTPAEKAVVDLVSETHIAEKTFVSVLDTPVLPTSGQRAERGTESSPLSAELQVSSAIVGPAVIPAAERHVVKTLFEAQAMTPLELTQIQNSVHANESSTTTVVTALPATANSSPIIPVTDTSIEKVTLVPELEEQNVTAVVPTSGQRETEWSPPQVSGAVETTDLIPDIETHIVKSNQVAVFEAPPLTKVDHTLNGTSANVKETLTVGTGLIAEAESPAMITILEKAIVKITPVSVMEAPAAAPEVPTPDQSSGKDTETSVSQVSAAVETSDVIPAVETHIVKTTQVAVFEAPNITTVEETLDRTAGIRKESLTPTVVVDLTAAETLATIPIVETPVLKATQISVLEAATVTTVVPTSDQNSIIGAPVGSQLSEGIPVVETHVVKTTQVAVLEASSMTPVEKTVNKTSVNINETSSPAVVISLTVPAETQENIPAMEATHLKTTQFSILEATTLTPVLSTPEQNSVRGTGTSPPSDVSPVSAEVQPSAVIPSVETQVVKTTEVEVLEAPHVTPVKQTVSQTSVTVKETSTPTVVTGLTTEAESPTVVPIVLTTIVKTTQVSELEAPPVTAGKQTVSQTSVNVKETSTPTVVTGLTTEAESPAVVPIVETPIVKTTQVSVLEAPPVTAGKQTQSQTLVTVKETSNPTVVTGLTTEADSTAVVPIVETPIVKTTQVSVLEAPPVTAGKQTQSQTSVTVKQTSTPTVVTGLTTEAESPTVVPIVETPIVKTTQVSVLEAPPVTAGKQTQSQTSVIVKETSTPTIVDTPIVKTTQVSIMEAPAVAPVADYSDQFSVQGEISPPSAVPQHFAEVETAVEPQIVKTIQVAVFEPPSIMLVEQALNQSSVRATETSIPMVVSNLNVPPPEMQSIIPVIETLIENKSPLAVLESPTLTPILHPSVAPSVKVKETDVSRVTAGTSNNADLQAQVLTSEIQHQGSIGETNVSEVSGAVETSVAYAVALATSPLSPVVQTPKQTLIKISPSDVSGESAALQTPVLTQVLETTALKTTQVASVVTPLEQTPPTSSSRLTGSSPPTVALNGKAEEHTHPLIQEMDIPLVKATQVAFLEAQAAAPIVQTSGQASVVIKEMEIPVDIPAETPKVIPDVECPAVQIPPVAVIEAPVAQTPSQVSVRVQESSPPVVSAVKTPEHIPAVETSMIKPAPAAVIETPVVQTPHQVLVSVNETTSTVAETPAATHIMRAPILEKSVVSLVLETTAPATITITEKPVRIPVVQTPAFVSVFLQEAASPMGTQSATMATETIVSQVMQPKLPETFIPVASLQEVPAVVPVMQIPIAGQVAQKPKLSTPSVNEVPVDSTAEKPAMISLHNSQNPIQLADSPAQAPVMLKLAMATISEAPTPAPLILTPEVLEANRQIVTPTSVATSQSLVVFENASTPPVSANKMNGSSNPSKEPLSEMEEDVWEDAVDDICNSETQESTANHESDAVI